MAAACQASLSLSIKYEAVLFVTNFLGFPSLIAGKKSFLFFVFRPLLERGLILEPFLLRFQPALNRNYWNQFSSVAQLCPTLCNPMNRSTPRLPVHHQLLEFTQTHVHRVGDAIQPSHPLSSPSVPAPKSLPASESFPMSKFFASGGESIGVSASASVLPVNTQD